MEFKLEHQLQYFSSLKRWLLGVIIATLLVSSGVKGLTMNPHAVLTITSEYGDIIDCVDIYKQPAFENPLLKNHTIKMRPSFLPTTEEGNSSRYPMEQLWHKSGICPEDTIPIIRAPATNGEFSYCNTEIARVEMFANSFHYYGAIGTFSAYHINVDDREWSSSSVSVFSKQGSFMEVGWAVSPVLFEDRQPRIFVNWLDKSKDQGCFNVRCAGYVHVSKLIPLGSPIPKVGKEFDYEFSIFRDKKQDKWWVKYQGEVLGYWPTTIFGNDFDMLAKADWGGSVCNSRSHGSHTNTQMGSGAFAKKDGAASVRWLKVMNSLGIYEGLPNSRKTLTCDDCYTVHPNKQDGVFYGGPGGANCDAKCKQ